MKTDTPLFAMVVELRERIDNATKDTDGFIEKQWAVIEFKRKTGISFEEACVLTHISRRYPDIRT